METGNDVPVGTIGEVSKELQAIATSADEGFFLPPVGPSTGAAVSAEQAIVLSSEEKALIDTYRMMSESGQFGVSRFAFALYNIENPPPRGNVIEFRRKEGAAWPKREPQ